MLVTMRGMLIKAQEEGYGVIAATMFDEGSMRMAVEAAEEKRSPLIMNINLTTKYLEKDFDSELYLRIARERAKAASVPIAINCDHARSYETIMKAIHLGFSSVMIDASSKPFEENAAIVKKVAEAAHACGLSVEAELGCVGIGNADDPDTMKSMGDKAVENVYTDPDVAREFVKETDVDCLAVSIGNAHGPYAKGIVPHIERKLLLELGKAAEIPLVLHGGSGTGDEQISWACKHGICKINIASDLMLAQIAAFEASAMPGFSRFRFEAALDAYKKEAMRYMDVMGCTGKAEQGDAKRRRNGSA